MKLHRTYANLEDANAATWELMEAGLGGGRARVIPGDLPLVEVDPAFGSARKAIAILEKRRPGDVAPAAIVEVADPAMGASGVGGDDPAPFSRMLGWPVLTSADGFLSTRLGWKLLINAPAPFSRLLGLKVLLNEKPTPAATAGGVSV